MAAMWKRAANVTAPTAGDPEQVTEPPLEEEGSFLSSLPIPTWMFVVGAVVLLLLIICCCCCCCRRCCRSKGKKKKVDSASMNRYLLDYEEGEMELDGGKGSKDKDEKPPPKPGKINYALEYDFKEEQLTIKVIRCIELPSMDFLGTSDPYVKVYILPDKTKFKTKVHKKTLNPVFNEAFKEKMKYADMRQKTVLFDVFDWDRFSRDDRIGQVQINLDTIDFSKPFQQWRDLKDGEHGEVCFSMRYVPTTSKLTIVILEASNLRKMDTRGLSDPYVKMSLYEEGKRYAKKKSTTKSCTLNPYYNESFTFKVSYERIKKSTLVISVVDYDRVGPSEPIGQVVLGENAIGSGMEHWRDVVDTPGKMVARRHALR